MHDKKDTLRRIWKHIPQFRPKELLHLACRKCGTEAYAASLPIADLFGGWTRLKRQRKGRYIGLCIDCSPRKSKKRRTP